MKGVFWFFVIGLIVGWLTGLIRKTRGFGCVSDLLAGMVGAVLGGWLFGVLGLTAYGFTGALVMAVIGSASLLSFVTIVKRV